MITIKVTITVMITPIMTAHPELYYQEGSPRNLQRTWTFEEAPTIAGRG